MARQTKNVHRVRQGSSLFNQSNQNDLTGVPLLVVPCFYICVYSYANGYIKIFKMQP